MAPLDFWAERYKSVEQTHYNAGCEKATFMPDNNVDVQGRFKTLAFYNICTWQLKHHQGQGKIVALQHTASWSSSEY